MTQGAGNCCLVPNIAFEAFVFVQGEVGFGVVTG